MFIVKSNLSNHNNAFFFSFFFVSAAKSLTSRYFLLFEVIEMERHLQYVCLEF